MSSEAPIEVIRAHFRPERIRTLFVGESAPASGDFFYCGNTSMAREMQKAVETGLGPTEGDFLKRLLLSCAKGWVRWIACAKNVQSLERLGGDDVRQQA